MYFNLSGVLACLDGYMNIALEQTEEYSNGQVRVQKNLSKRQENYLTSTMKYGCVNHVVSRSKQSCS